MFGTSVIRNKIHRLLPRRIGGILVSQRALHILRVNTHGQMATISENLVSADLRDLSAPVGLSHLISC